MEECQSHPPRVPFHQIVSMFLVLCLGNHFYLHLPYVFLHHILRFVAASTAASLLTGATMPFDSLNANGATPPPPSPPIPTPSRPGMPSDPSADPPSAEAARLRLRNAWSSLRDRIGTLGGTAGAGAASPSLPVGTAPEDSAPAGLSDTRRALLDELNRVHGMGRAIGDAPNVPGETTPNPTSSTLNLPPQTSATTPPIVNPAQDQNISVNIPLSLSPRLIPPVAGTFERFLFDLQAELRIALTTPIPVDSATSHDQSGEHVEEAPSSNPTSSNDGESSSTSLEHSDRSSSSSVMDISNAAPTPAQEPSSSSSTASERSNDAQGPATPRANGEINWWRLYRFPAMQVAQGRGVPASTPIVSPAPSNLARSTSPPLNDTFPEAGVSPIPPSLPSALTDAQATLPSVETSTPIESVVESIIPPTSPRPVSTPVVVVPTPNATQMVPVIVIGIQSVPLGVNNMEEDAGTRADTATATATDAPSPADPSTMPDEEDRGRPWTSRAAAALRNLRAGRRGGPAQQPEQTGPPGSRMFLIYVIGGT